tara:strand:- start:24092 stop:24901 length:810 start_codon:yes stop_codon:yes gene_type:complete
LQNFAFSKKGNHMFYLKKITSAIALTATLLVGLPAQADLVAFYNFNNGSAEDVSGNGNDGVSSTLAPSFTANGYEGGAFDFNQSSNSFTVLPVDIGPTSMPEITMGGWFKTDAINGITGLLSHDNCCYDRQLGIDTRGGGGYTYSGFAGNGVQGSTPVVIGEWTFLAFRHSQLTGDFTLDVNGVHYDRTGVTYTDGTTQLYLGRNPNYDHPFDGQADNVFVFDHILTDQELVDMRVQGESFFSQDVSAPAIALFALSMLPFWRRQKKIK